MAPVNEEFEVVRQEVEEPNRNELIHISFSFVTYTWLGKLKVAELVISLLCGACASSVLSECRTDYDFLGFVAWCTFVNVLIDFILRILGLWRYWIFRHPALMLALCGVACLGFLIGGSLAASCARKATSYSTACAASVFAFFCLALFAVETYIHFQKYRSMEAEDMPRQPSEEGSNYSHDTAE